MSRSDKLIEKFLRKPESVTFRELLKILELHGFTAIKAKGSHLKFKHPKHHSDFIIPVHNNDCKEFYKKLAHQFIQKVR